jgi:nitrogen regulatory protein PII-like uncharacterized protein
MTGEIQFKYKSDNIHNADNVGYRDLSGKTVAISKCPFCEHKSAFNQIGIGSESLVEGHMVALLCNNCESIISCNIDENNIYPTPEPDSLDNLPEPIEDYYNEGIRCLGANAPNGAATVFRKVIHAVCMYYDMSDVESNESFYDMIQILADEGVITETLRQSLLGVKDAGNDGAHINENDPSMEQARNMKDMIDAVLTATVVADQKVESLREEHPNPHQE